MHCNIINLGEDTGKLWINESETKQPSGWEVTFAEDGG